MNQGIGAEASVGTEVAVSSSEGGQTGPGGPAGEPSAYELSYLETLEAQSIHIMREVAAEFERPVLLFSGGKDSIVMLHLAAKAFAPAAIPFPVMHVDTGRNFTEVLEFRDRRVAELGVRLVVASVQEDIDAGLTIEEVGPGATRNRLQTPTLLRGISNNRFDAVFGGARRDEEKARAKERIFSFRDQHGQWDPKNQRPELWDLYNGRHRRGEHIRVFPLSNWTELDIWQYIADEQIEVPSIYFAHNREVFWRDGMMMAVSQHLSPADGEEVIEARVRFRTVGDADCTGCVESAADTIERVISEVAATRLTERGATRADDRISEAGMEDRKREGYF
jgi:sulfate adenylyltransferase subunit 2